jgi:hypothetical protein
MFEEKKRKRQVRVKCFSVTEMFPISHQYQEKNYTLLYISNKRSPVFRPKRLKIFGDSKKKRKRKVKVEGEIEKKCIDFSNCRNCSQFKFCLKSTLFASN